MGQEERLGAEIRVLGLSWGGWGLWPWADECRLHPPPDQQGADQSTKLSGLHLLSRTLPLIGGQSLLDAGGTVLTGPPQRNGN